MSDTIELLNEARRRCNPSTWYRLAKEIDVSQQRISGWIHGRHMPDVEGCLRLATFLGVKAEDVFGIVMAERNAGGPHGEFWRRMAPRLLILKSSRRAALGQTMELDF